MWYNKIFVYIIKYRSMTYFNGGFSFIILLLHSILFVWRMLFIKYNISGLFFFCRSLQRRSSVMPSVNLWAVCRSESPLTRCSQRQLKDLRTWYTPRKFTRGLNQSQILLSLPLLDYTNAALWWNSLTLSVWEYCILKDFQVRDGFF